MSAINAMAGGMGAAMSMPMSGGASAGATMTAATPAAGAATDPMQTAQSAYNNAPPGQADSATIAKLDQQVSQMLASIDQGLAGNQLLRTIIALMILKAMLGDDKDKDKSGGGSGLMAMMALAAAGAIGAQQGIPGASGANMSSQAVQGAGSGLGYGAEPRGLMINVMG